MIVGQAKQCQRGFLTLEILLAMAIMIFVLAAAVLLSFGGQGLAVASRSSSEAQNFAQKLLESQRELGRKDFRIANPTSAQEGIFQGKIEVASHSFFTKSIKAQVSWNDDGRPQKVDLSTLIADYNGTAGNDTCDSFLIGDWTEPRTKEYNFFQLTNIASGDISDIDAYRGKLYVTVGDSATSTDPTFFVFDISDPKNMKLMEKIDNSSNKSGLNAVAVNGSYAYVANDSSANQFQIIDIKKSPVEIAKEYKIPGVVGGRGNCIFYKDGYVYLGLTSTANNTPEFHIIDVKNASTTVEIGRWPSFGSLKHVINSIYVKGEYAYLAHPTDAYGSGGCPQEQLTVLDISNPAQPKRVSGFYYDGFMGGNGKSLHLVGDRLYFGRTASNISGPSDPIPEFYIIDNSKPESLLSAALGSFSLPVADSVNGVLIKDYLAFLVGRKNMQIIKIDELANIHNWGSAAFNAAGNETFEPSFDCEGNNFFIGSNNSGNSYLTLITAE